MAANQTWFNLTKLDLDISWIFFPIFSRLWVEWEAGKKSQKKKEWQPNYMDIPWVSQRLFFMVILFMPFSSKVFTAVWKKLASFDFYARMFTIYSLRFVYRDYCWVSCCSCKGCKISTYMFSYKYSYKRALFHLCARLTLLYLFYPKNIRTAFNFFD